MKLHNAKNLRAFLFAVHAVLILFFAAALLTAGFLFRRANRNHLADNALYAGLIRTAEELLAENQGACIRLALHRTDKDRDEALRRILQLRDASEALMRHLYGQSQEYRLAVRDLFDAVNLGIPELNRHEKENLFESGFQKYYSNLQDAAVALQRIRLIQDESQEKQARQMSRDFLLLEILLFVFFLFSLAWTTFGFSLIGRTMKRAMQSLSEGTSALRTGDLSFRFQDITPDEIGRIKYDINMMAHRLFSQSQGLRKANSELRDQAEKLIAAHQHKDRFLSNMSHELRTPLSSIIGFAELIEARAGRMTPEKLQSNTRRILQAAEHLLELITALLDLAKSGAGVLKPVISEFDLSSVIRETAALLSPLAEKKSLAVSLDLVPELTVHADLRMIRQIFINLFGNAVKYTKEGSISVTLKQQENEAVLSIADTGIGIPEEEQGKIFTDFHRVDNGPDMMTDGVGIGLALSRRLAELHKGKLTFRSKYGEGSIFTFTFPV